MVGSGLCHGSIAQGADLLGPQSAVRRADVEPVGQGLAPRSDLVAAIDVEEGQRLQQLAGPRQLVESELEKLRTEPLSVPEREQLVADQQQLEGARDRQAHLLRDLRHLIENRSALGWADAAAALQQQTVEREMLEVREPRRVGDCLFFPG